VHEALGLFIASAREQGTLDEVLEECGYTLNGTHWTALKIVAPQHEPLVLKSIPRIRFAETELSNR
jgi:hypothetical protein